MKTITLVRSDLKNIFRDPSMWMILLAPVGIIAILRIAPPLYEPYFNDMIRYRPLILGTFTLLGSALAGFLMAFVMLDEKDQQLFDVFRVMPLSFDRLIIIRVILMLVCGFILCMAVILGSGLVEMSFFKVVALSFLCALSGPANTLLIVSIAHNKIEGATYFKGLNMFVMAPIAAIFILSPLRYLLGIIPFFWIFTSFMEYKDPESFMLHLGVGILVNLLYLAGTFFLLTRRRK